MLPEELHNSLNGLSSVMVECGHEEQSVKECDYGSGHSYTQGQNWPFWTKKRQYDIEQQVCRQGGNYKYVVPHINNSNFTDSGRSGIKSRGRKGGEGVGKLDSTKRKSEGCQ